uniref:Uncharacterized protein n=1 Tax=Chromera velia CCMP2878 TaxID=1169474 RepID=A0A0G4IB41_9ALVE|eukprot:Cvel_12726.t1-p1 / transcript=Cvel_12726.t1 / gene=Cvel_12726 / organism=Chromera_velia_CCMP2878 / gene_product=hypothetical protein / transcript_product=hypothetical protein / location=Cvel_scaffold845:31478-32299(-) / protein_length=274 / sequence_SO=supercontig / SO=protein_coding / is_pseudo=false
MCDVTAQGHFGLSDFGLMVSMCTEFTQALYDPSVFARCLQTDIMDATRGTPDLHKEVFCQLLTGYPRRAPAHHKDGWRDLLVELIRERTLQVHHVYDSAGPFQKETLLTVALEAMMEDVSALSRFKPVLLALLTAGSRLDVRLDDGGATPLHHAIDVLSSHEQFLDEEVVENFVKTAKAQKVLRWTFETGPKATPLGPPGLMTACMNPLHLAFWRQNRLFVDVILKEDSSLNCFCELVWRESEKLGAAKISKRVPAWHIPIYSKDYSQWGLGSI